MFLAKVMFTQRKKGVKITDKRIRLTTEVLQGIRLIKFYAWEDFYTNQIGRLRKAEIATVRKVAIARSILIAVVTFIPILASILSFITYALSGHDLNVAIIFSSLQLFNVHLASLVHVTYLLIAISILFILDHPWTLSIFSIRICKPFGRPCRPGKNITVSQSRGTRGTVYD